MGAHGTCEEAIANVAAFADASTDEDRDLVKSSKHASKSKSKLAKGREAVRGLRDILACWPDLRKDLREILWRLDQGQALDVTSIPDVAFRAQLVKLFDNLQLRKTEKGVYGRSKTGAPVLTFLGPIFEELPAEPSAAMLSSMKLAANGDQSHGDDSHRPDPTPAQQRSPGGSSQERKAGSGAADAGAAAQRAQQQQDAEGAQEEVPEEEGPEPLVIGPDMGPLRDALGQDADVADRHTSVANGGAVNGDREAYHREALGSSEGDDRSPGAAGAGSGEPTEADGDAAAGSNAIGTGRRVAGPAMPPPEVLAAAAQVAAEMLAAEEEEEEDFELVGPPPPEMVQEVEDAGDDERSVEVVRVLRLLEEGKRTPEGPDAYAVVGVEPTAKSGEIKKRYWRLSLLIHPDKCPHPRANEAFQAVSKAAKALQDQSRRSAIDRQREDDVLRRHAVAAAEQQERERQWRMVRGEATAEDLAGPVQRGPAARDSWMTDLPVERRPKPPSQKNQTTFAKNSIQGRGDTSAWTDTPAQRLERLQNGAGQAALPSTLSAADQRRASATAKLVDQYNASSRRRTLVEQHQERLEAEKKAKTKKRKAEGKPDEGSEAWVGNHPWRPFDREKDLGAVPGKPISKEELLKQSGTLSNRFGDTSKTQRHFL
ncbi:hypothetical protein WJX72_003080 [[Myrmecia] bisecta]|uniref:J domain-containing protein n=1 Tax=[Myrmecia] bisecta TaxID=41462 RepID=A0AAW1P3U7_9CHLO